MKDQDIVSSAEPRMKIAVGIATIGRASVLRETLRLVGQQKRLPDRLVVCGTQVADVEGVEVNFPSAEVIFGEKGLTRQRNSIIEKVDDCDILVFVDDDFLLCNDYLVEVEKAFLSTEDLVMLTGNVLADGAITPELTYDNAVAIVAEAERASPDSGFRPTLAGYGCNMAIGMQPVREHKLRFDVNLPLYGWLEDWAFSGLLRAVTGGSILKSSSARGVHLGSKSGRQSGVRLGYSQIANPFYLSKLKILPKDRLFALARNNMVSNITRVLRPEPHIDRAGRLRGNILAIFDIVRGKCDPQRVVGL